MPYGHLRYWLLPLLRRRLHAIVGLENLPLTGGFIVAANHNAWIDSPLMGGALYKSVGKMVYVISSSKHWQRFGSLPIDFNNRAAVIDTAAQKIANGHSIVIFPEGRSNSSTTLLPPHTGVARLAFLTGAPVIPAGIRGSAGHSMLQSLACFFSRRPITIHFGTPLHFPKLPADQHTNEQLHQTSATIMAAIAPLAGKTLTA